MGIIRLLLAASVIAGHSTPIFGLSIIGADDAVHAFFIISGFYMSLILNEKYIKRNNSYRLYITNRLSRIYPVYWVVLGLIVIFSIGQHYYTRVVSAYGSDYGLLSVFWIYYRYLNPFTLAYFIFTNIFIIGQDTLLFLGLSASGGLHFVPSFTTLSLPLYKFVMIPQAWAISLEILFYFIAPFLVRRSWKFIAGLALCSLALRILVAKFGLNTDPWNDRFFPTELVFFLSGSISYKMYTHIKQHNLKAWNLMVIWISLVVITLLYKLSGIAQYSYVYFFVFMITIPYIFLLSGKWHIDRYIGELAYPLYISHVFILYEIQEMTISNFKGTGANVFITSLIISIMLYEMVIRKVDKFRQRRIA